MPTNPNWPLVLTQFSPSTDPFDPAAVPSWADISTSVLEFGQHFGRQYELDQNEAGEATVDLWDPGEAFNPANTSSPHSPGIKPYRRIIDQAMWPPTPVGAATNLLPGQGVDPTFDSYAVSSQPSWITAVGGVSPVASTTTPQQGTQCLSWSVAGGATVQGVSWQVTCIPGQQYTCSAYVRQSSSSTQQITAAGVTGSSTSTAGAYVRLTVTFTASQTAHTVQLATTGTAVAGAVLLDAVQHEPGATATTFATSGPTIYNLFGGYVERWPRSWQDGGVTGRAKITCVDGLAILAGQYLQTEYRNAVLAKKPDYYWPLSEPIGATTFAEVSGNAGPPLRRQDSKFGPALTFAPGTQMGVPGDPGCAGLHIDWSGFTGAGWPASAVSAGIPRTPGVTLGGPLPQFYTVALWVQQQTAAPASGVDWLLLSHDGAGLPGGAVPLLLQMDPTNLKASTYINGISPGAALVVANPLADGQPHLLVFVTHITATQVEAKMLTAAGAWFWNQNGTFPAATYMTPRVQLGAYIDDAGTSNPGLPNTTYAHLAIWNRALTDPEISDLFKAGKGYPGETSGARISRYLGYNWVGPTAIDAGASTMDVSNLAADTAVLTACQNVTTSENGDLYVDGAGVPTYAARTRRYLATTAKWVFGESAGAGELPYEEDLKYDYDPTLVYNDVHVTRASGIEAVGGTQAAITASQRTYGKRNYPRTVNITSDLETQDAANWLFAGHAQAAQRIAELTIIPSANPALWPCALGAQKGDRCTVKRRTSAGYVMSADFFIDRIERVRKSGEWTVKFQLTPAALTRQPWILGDATYGVLDSTTTLGY